jgi:hypothetical protein
MLSKRRKCSLSMENFVLLPYLLLLLIYSGKLISKLMITEGKCAKKVGSLLTIPSQNHFLLSGLSQARPISLSAVIEIGTRLEERMVKDTKLADEMKKMEKALVSHVNGLTPSLLAD